MNLKQSVPLHGNGNYCLNGNYFPNGKARKGKNFPIRQPQMATILRFSAIFRVPFGKYMPNQEVEIGNRKNGIKRRLPGSPGAELNISS